MKTNKDRAVIESKQLRGIARKAIREVWSRYACVDEENWAWALLKRSQDLRESGR